MFGPCGFRNYRMKLPFACLSSWCLCCTEQVLKFIYFLKSVKIWWFKRNFDLNFRNASQYTEVDVFSFKLQGLVKPAALFTFCSSEICVQAVSCYLWRVCSASSEQPNLHANAMANGEPWSGEPTEVSPCLPDFCWHHKGFVNWAHCTFASVGFLLICGVNVWLTLY